jgi:hypothetical protein
LDDEKIVCFHCGEEVNSDSINYISDDPVCDSCLSEYTVTCDRCGAIIWQNENAGTDRIPLCQECFDGFYTRCTQCDVLISLSNAYYMETDDESPLCNTCYEEAQEEAEQIHPYSYKPEPIFYGNGSRFIGIELEIDGAGKSEEHAKELLRIANAQNEHLYIKTDGSLDDGLELVSHPMTLDYHLNCMPWGEILKAAIGMGYTSHKTSTCGLHFHVSRDSLGNSDEEQEDKISKILFFVEKHWDEILIFSRRTQTQLDRWAARYGFKDYPWQVMDQAKKSPKGRYACINLTNRDTIEFRMLRGTLKLNTFMAALQFVNAICDAAISLSEKEMRDLSWQQFVLGIDQRAKPELIEYLRIKRLFVNEPVYTEEDI